MLAQNATAQRQLDTSIRRTNWDSLLAHDKKHFNYSPDGLEGLEEIHLPYTDFIGAPAGVTGGLLDSAFYSDLNHDDCEDAIMKN
jgi:hypothetical protein